MIAQKILIEPDLLRYLEIFFMALMAGGAVYFGLKQTEINKRLKELQDYIAVSIIPGNKLTLTIMNVGKANLYIYRWEIASLSETFKKAVLLPASAKSFVSISLNSIAGNFGKHDFKVYIMDEYGNKYVSTGEVFLDPIPVKEPPLSKIEHKDSRQELTPQQTQQTAFGVGLRAYSHRTKRYNWKL